MVFVEEMDEVLRGMHFLQLIFATKQRCNALQSVAHIVRYLSNGDLLATKDAIKSLPKFSHNGLMAVPTD